MPIDSADLVTAAIRARGSAILTVRGDSMLPTLQPGATVRIDRVAFDDVVAGQVVAARLGPDVFVHRVVARSCDALHTAGDNMGLLDPAVTRDRLLGVVADVTTRTPVRTLTWPGGSSGPGHLWVLGTVPGDVRSSMEEAGWHVHGRPGPTADTLAELRERAAGRYRIGVSEYGAHDARVVLAGGPPADSHIVIGRRFGTHPMLPPGAVDTHVRLSSPGHDLRMHVAARRLAGILCHARTEATV